MRHAATPRARSATARSYVERLVTRPRHVEIQIFADDRDQAVSLFERECSLQRRHQKVIEESPSPAMTPELRQAMSEAAVAAARACGYTERRHRWSSCSTSPAARRGSTSWR
jgi:acetyl/propionyl-CoA carboxylase alpha subunit